MDFFAGKYSCSGDSVYYFMLRTSEGFADNFFVFMSKVINIVSLDVMLVINAGILTMFIPIGVYIFEYKRDFSQAGRNTIIGLIGAKNFLMELGCIFAFLLFWNTNEALVKWMIFFIWVFGIFLVMARLDKLYKWISAGDKYRISMIKIYLNNSDVYLDSVRDSWESVWLSKDRRYDLDFFDIFSKKVDGLLANSDFKGVEFLLSSFSDNLDKRGIGFIVINGNVFPKILEWHFKIWNIEYNEGEKKILECSMILRNIVELIIKRSIKESQSLCLFEHIKKHIETYEHETVKKKNSRNDENPKHYYEYLPIYRGFFENVCDCYSGDDIWRNFPSKWKITLENLKDDDNKRMSLQWWKEFLKWSYERINSNDDKFDRCLDNVSDGLFPKINSIDWAIILTFSLNSYIQSSGEDIFSSRIRNLIESKRNFGFSVTGSGQKDFNAEMEEWSRNAAELACNLFKNDWIRDIDKYVDKLEKIPGNKEEELRIFKCIQGIEQR